MSTKSVTELVDQINKITTSARGDITSDKAVSYQLLLASREQNAVLEPPAQSAIFAAFSGVHLTCTGLAIELRLFEKIASTEQPPTTHDLVADGSARETLVLSILRVLVAKDFVGETTTDNGSNAYGSWEWCY